MQTPGPFVTRASARGAALDFADVKRNTLAPIGMGLMSVRDASAEPAAPIFM